ncbi:MAG TPA: MFS transporter [Candidatus Eubacterium faecipullorum]|uniref:MFS transporter n=1 Tax=Candidatus Eubacterium faecipullorum TaxID=2838571 RepID=A0A9D1RGF8_9FIRM|nr:MFS transporter [Candidatus Eubacterium faecipullorum]
MYQNERIYTVFACSILLYEYDGHDRLIQKRLSCKRAQTGSESGLIIQHACQYHPVCSQFLYNHVYRRPPSRQNGQVPSACACGCNSLRRFARAQLLAPPALAGNLLLVYVTTIAVLWAVATNFGDSINKVAFVMTPNLKERDNVISFRSIFSAVGNSAPLVIVLVIALIFEDEGTQYIVSAALCAVIGTILMLVGTKTIKERVAYSSEKKNPLIGIKDVLVDKYAWVIIISEFLKNFRQIATYMGVFLAAALLGGTDQYLWFGLPTGIGTAVGMLVINFLLKKFNSKVLYIASGIYSVIINSIAFAVGYIYFNNPSPVLQVIFIVFLFLIGLQFGASNLLPSMFQADVLEDIEVKTGGKRLDATLPFVIGIFTMISGTIAQALAPLILYGENSIIGYIQPSDLVPEPEQSLQTRILLLFFYTVFHGIMMFLAGVPFFFYKLTGKRKEEIHTRVLELRAEFDQENN